MDLNELNEEYEIATRKVLELQDELYGLQRSMKGCDPEDVEKLGTLLFNCEGRLAFAKESVKQHEVPPLFLAE